MKNNNDLSFGIIMFILSGGFLLMCMLYDLYCKFDKKEEDYE